MFRAELDALGSVGFIGDRPGHTLPGEAWTNVENARMHAGHVEKVGGYVAPFDVASVVPYWLGSFASATKRYLIHAGNTGVFADDGSARYSLCSVPLTATISDKITAGGHNGIFFFNNGVDVPKVWGGDPLVAMIDMTGWPATDRAKAMRKVSYYQVALNITRSGTNHPSLVMWSAAAEPGVLGSWTPATSNDAGEVERVGGGALVDALELGEVLVLYFERSMCVMRWIGGTDVFAFQDLPDKYGMLAPNCGAAVPEVGHVVLTMDDVIAHAGNGAQSIIDGVNKKWLFDSMDANYKKQSFVVAHPKKPEVWICFPETGHSACTKALVWNWSTKVWSKRDLPNAISGGSVNVDFSTRSWDDQTATFDAAVGTWDGSVTTFSSNETTLFIGTSDAKLYAMDFDTQADGVNFTMTLERTGLNRLAGAEALADRVKDLCRIRLDVEATAGTVLTVYAGASYDPDVAPTYGSGVTFTVGTDRWVDVWANGGYQAYKITAAGNAAVSVHRAVLEFADDGSEY